MMKLMMAAAAAVTLAGCVSPQMMQQAEAVEPWETEEANLPVECKGAAQCATVWRAAQVWVANNSGFKMQVVSDAIIQTYNAPNYSQRYAFQVTREPRGGDLDRILIVPSCGGAPMCRLSPWRMSARFNRAMRQVMTAAK